MSYHCERFQFPVRLNLSAIVDSISMEVVESAVVSIKHLGDIDCKIQCRRLIFSAVGLDSFPQPHLATLALAGTPVQPRSLSRFY